MHTTLIDPAALMDLLARGPAPALFDCSADLMNPPLGRQQYLQGHLPGARHADMDLDLSDKTGHSDAASGGRHPLPSRERFAAWLGGQGVDNRTQVVVYDRNGSMYCGRLWWMLKWCGHEAVAVLDGGLAAWQTAGGGLSAGEEPAPVPRRFVLGEPRAQLRTKAEVAAALDRPQMTLVDARATPRYRGEVEPIDPVAGHIPGALNRPFGSNMGADGRFKPADQLRQEFESLLGGRDPATVVHQCGSGVSAIPNLLAMELAGLGRAALFAGSWSEWCRDSSLPVARGE